MSNRLPVTSGGFPRLIHIYYLPTIDPRLAVRRPAPITAGTLRLSAAARVWLRSALNQSTEGLQLFVIDTHSHILPGLDDGSPDLGSSLRMAQAASAAGVSTIVCTPHLLEFDPARIEKARETLEMLRAGLDRTGIGLRLILGFEVDLSVAASASLSELTLLTFEGSRGLMLLEMPHWGWPMLLRQTIFQLRMNGITPLLAHPERNDRIQRSPALLGECLDAGAVGQATVSSLDGSFGRASKVAFSRQLSLGYVSVLASDAHLRRRSSWTVTDVAASLRRKLSKEDVDLLIRVNPERLLAGEPPLRVTAPRASAWRNLGGKF